MCKPPRLAKTVGHMDASGGVVRVAVKSYVGAAGCPCGVRRSSRALGGRRRPSTPPIGLRTGLPDCARLSDWTGVGSWRCVGGRLFVCSRIHWGQRPYNGRPTQRYLYHTDIFPTCTVAAIRKAPHRTHTHTHHTTPVSYTHLTLPTKRIV